ncbi:hypothetical protein FOMPIDRAFT_7921, partial [Fomitopsis schrenkii]
CAETCIKNTSPGSCSATDERCLCASLPYVHAVESCIETSCPTTQIGAADSALAAICSQAV